MIEKKKHKFSIKLDYTAIFLGCYVIFLIELCLVSVLAEPKEYEKAKEEVVVEKVKTEVELSLKEQYEKNKSINDDYVGQIYFDSGLINLPFVQGATNNTYFRTDWETMKYDIGGSIFMDCENNMTKDQNIILYGHNYGPYDDPTLTKMFTPLRVLKDQKNYEENKIVNLYLGDYTLKYQVLTVYLVQVTEMDGKQYISTDDPVYVTRNYKSKDLFEYIEKFKEREFYDTGLTIDKTDRLLTLQTCVDGSTDKLIVVAKLIETIKEEE